MSSTEMTYNEILNKKKNPKEEAKSMITGDVLIIKNVPNRITSKDFEDFFGNKIPDFKEKYMIQRNGLPEQDQINYFVRRVKE